MVLTFTPQTELDAINQMLASVGKAPVSELDDTGIKDVEFGRLTLHNTLREVLTEGWDFNTDDEYEITPDVNGIIAVDPSILSIRPTYGSQRYVQRYSEDIAGMAIYDKEEQTFNLNTTDPIKFDVTWFFEFEAIPQAARAFIAHKAGRIFQAQFVASEMIYRFTKEREVETRAELEREHRRTARPNIFRAATATARIANRQHGYRRIW